MAAQDDAIVPVHGLQVVSDIHLEFRGKHINYSELLPRRGTDLAICGDLGRPFMTVYGDICHYREFLMYAASTWRHVFVVTGNHCYYGRRKSETDERVQAYCNERSNLHFLNDTAYIFTEHDRVPFYGVYGSTLWTNVTDHAFSYMNDHRIRPERQYETAYTRKSTRMSADVVRVWHQAHVTALTDHLSAHALPGDKKWIVMSHHPPRSPPVQNLKSHADRATWSAYFNNLSEKVFDKGKIAVWLCGHLHAHFDATLDGIRYVSNCMGYASEKNVGYNDSCIIPYQ